MGTKLQISLFCLTIVLFECDGYLNLNLNFLQARHVDIPYLPMLVPPKKWKGYVGVHVLDLSSKFFNMKQFMIGFILELTLSCC